MRDACSALAGPELTPADAIDALDSLAFRMLVERDLQPDWSTIRTWFKDAPDRLKALRAALHDRRLVRLEAGGDRLLFRHDRVRAALLAEALGHRIRADSLAEELWREPYYAELIGQALAAKESGTGALDTAARLAPLAVVHALEWLAGMPDPRLPAIVSTVRDWISGPAGKADQNEALCWSMQWVLRRLDAPIVAELCDAFGRWSLALEEARFRNGDARGGAAFFWNHEPSTRFSHRDRLVAHILRHHRDAIIAGTIEGLGLESRHKMLVGYLRLAGELAVPELAESIARCWHSRTPQEDLLSHFLWAGLRCGEEDPGRLLQPMVDFWLSLPEPDEKKYGEGRGIVLAHLEHAPTRGLPSAVIRYLVGIAEDASPLAWPITFLIEDVDDPDAQTFVVRQRARTAERLEGTKGFSPWLASRPRFPSDPVRIFSDASRSALAGLWRDRSASRHRREQAFITWSGFASPADLPWLLEIGPEDLLWARALRKRVRLGDRSAFPLISQEMAKDADGEWWQPFDREWHPEMNAALEAEFERWEARGRIGRNNLFYLPRILMRAEPELAERILERHWPMLRGTPNFVQAALYVATDRTIALARAAIDRAADPRKMLEFIDSKWEIGGTESRGRLTPARLAAIEPYLGLLDDFCVLHFWNACNHVGLIALRRDLIDPILSPKWRGCEGVDDSALLAAFDRDLDCTEGHGRAWVEVRHSRERSDPPDRLPHLLGDWLAGKSSLEALKVAADYLVEMGSRSALGLLDLPGTAEGPEADAIRANCRFRVRLRSLK